MQLETKKRPGLSTQPRQNSNPLMQCGSACASARLLNVLIFLLHEHRLADLLLDRALQVERTGREVGGAGLLQEGIEAAIVVDAFERIGRNPQAHVAAERVRDEGDVDQVRQEPALGLDVRVAHLVAHLGTLGGQFALTGHRKILFHPRLRAAHHAPRGGPKSRPFAGTADL
jgi:hypothetical protein